ncbi:MAG: hypothetical protein IKO34_13040 [Bacteroidales bacterium]|nr:hypothetical protein [Bacteroidales bacterium]
MRKVIFTMLIIVAGIISATAKPDVVLVKGSLSALKSSKAKVFVRWDYSNSTIEGKEVGAYLKERGDDWVRDYDAEIARAEASFRERLDEKSGDVSTVAGEDAAEYIIVMKVSDFQYGQAALSAIVGFGAGDSHLSGTMEIYKKGQSEPIAVLDVDGVPGSGYGNEIRRVEAYRELAENLAKLIKKGK